MTAVSTPLVAYALNITGSGVSLDEHFWALTASSFVSIAVMLGVLFGAKYTILRGAASQPNPVGTLAVILLSQVLRAWVFDQLLVASGVAEHSEFWFRLVAAIPVFGVSIPLTGYLVSLSRDYSRTAAQTRLIRAELDAAQATAQQVIAEHRDVLQHRVRAVLEAEIAALMTEAPERALTQVQHIIDEVVRPLSRELTNEIHAVAEPELEVPKRADWLAVVRNVMNGTPIHPLLIAGWIAFVGMLWVFLRIDPAMSLLYSVMVFGIVGATLQVAKWLWSAYSQRIRPVWRAFWYTAALVLSTLLVNFVTSLIPVFAVHLSGSIWVSNTMLVLSAGWSVALVLSLRREQQRSLAELEVAQRELREQYVRLNTALRLQQVSIGRAVHGPVQDALSAAAIRLARAVGSGEAAAELVAELRGSVAASLHNLASDSQQNLAALLAGLQELWAGSVEIRFELSTEVDELLAMHPASAMTASEVVRGACANAIRHGRATEVELEVSCDSLGLQVVVTDNGSGFGGLRAPGIGSATLNELCLNWSLSRAGDQTVLTALVPIV